MFLDHEVQENALGKLSATEKGEAPASRISEEGRRRSDFRWPYGRHQRIHQWSRVLDMGTPYSVGKGKTEEGKAKTWEVIAHYVEREG
jgi:hypothetical protein